MRVFLSAFSGFTLAVPMNAVAAMMLYDKETEKTVHYDQQSRSTYVSLPRLFRLPNEIVQHGIVLREWNSKVNKVVLLTAEVKRDIEIPDEQIHPLPKVLGALRFSEIFSGIQFSDNPILLLNVKQLAEYIQREQWVLDKEKEQPAPTEVKNEVQALDIQDEQPSATDVKNEVLALDIQDEQPSATDVKNEVQALDIQDEQPLATDAKNEVQALDIQDEQPSATDVKNEVQALDIQDEQQLINIQCEEQIINIGE